MVLLWARLVGQASPTSDFMTPLFVYGPLGIFAAFGLFFLTKFVQKLIAERDEERAYTKELEKKLREDVVPAMSSLTNTNAEAVKALADNKVVITQSQAEQTRLNAETSRVLGELRSELEAMRQWRSTR